MVIIPAFNEQNAVGKVIADIPKKYVSTIIVVDNGSTDDTFLQAQKGGAIALYESKKGYGNACLKGLNYLENLEKKPDIVVFLDGDYADYPQQLVELVTPIVADKADLVIGSRTLGKKEEGSMTIQQIFGNWLATQLMYWFYHVKYTDLGPFRAIRYSSLLKIDMKDKTYGWTVEMQLKAAKLNLRTMEVPTNYKKRIGVSKVSGTITGTIGAGYKILYTIFKYL